MLLVSEISALVPLWIQITSSLLIGYFIYILVSHKTRNHPPGPWGLPLLGYLPFVGLTPHIAYWKLSKKYGDIVMLKLANRNVVTLNSYEAIRECFVHKGDEFSGRLFEKKSFLYFLGEGVGIIQEEGPIWREHRRFALHTLRDFGFGKLSLEARVQEIGKDLISGLEQTLGKPYDPMNLLANATFNVILYLITDKHYKPDDPDFVTTRKSVKVILTKVISLFQIVQTPLHKILPIEWHPGFKEVHEALQNMRDMSSKFIREHEETFDENNLRDFTDVFLSERNNAVKEGKDTDSIFVDKRLRSMLLNLLFAGTETTSNSIYWALRLISHRPKMQKRLHQEIDEVVGKERLPSILDRPNMPYTEAFILELFRFTTIAPTGIPHSNPEQATLQGYTIPKRSLIMPNIWAVHNDPKNWTEPEKFDPDRFMDPETRTKRRERVIPFAIGKRSCLGETLARMELFVFLTMLLQKFQFEPEEGDRGEIEVTRTIIRVLQPYKLCCKPRQ